MRLIAEIVASVVVLALVAFSAFGLELLPTYLVDYLLRSGLVYQGY
jgi:hypothetical protein